MPGDKTRFVIRAGIFEALALTEKWGDTVMCEFCMEHGEGKKWYLEASNYSEDLLSDMKRQKLLKSFMSEASGLENPSERFEKLAQAPWLVRRFLRWRIVKTMKKNHYGQILPIEDVAKILDFTNSIVRISCICRYLQKKEEKRYCYGVSLGGSEGKFQELLGSQGMSFLTGPDSKGLETLTKEETIEAFREHEREGLCHSVWTFRTPFIGGICNCDRPDCLAMQSTVTYDVPVMFRAEYVAILNQDQCIGCRKCMTVCQFGAISYSAASKSAHIDPALCYGCGVCRAQCEREAIRLVDRSEVKQVANLW